MGPHPREARQQILELGELHLHLRFRRARPRGEDVQNHLGAVHHPHRQRLFEIGPLRGRQRLVEQHQRGTGLLKDALQLLHFPLAEVQVGRGRLEPLVGAADDVRAGGVGQPAELVQVLVHLHRVGRPFPRRTDQERPLQRRLDVD